MKRLAAHLRVFFDKRSGKAERIEQFTAERGIEYGLQIVTQFFLNLPDCLYLKKSCEFLQSYEKTSEMQKEKLFFFSFPSASNFGNAKVTKKREQCKRKVQFSFHPVTC